jgi:hypothetical protein
MDYLRAAILPLSLTALFLACGTAEEVQFKCDPGETNECLCGSANPGVQVCNVSGVGWGECSKCEGCEPNCDGNSDSNVPTPADSRKKNLSALPIASPAAPSCGCPDFIKEGTEYWVDFDVIRDKLYLVLEYNSSSCWAEVKRDGRTSWINFREAHKIIPEATSQ